MKSVDESDEMVREGVYVCIYIYLLCSSSFITLFQSNYTTTYNISSLFILHRSTSYFFIYQERENMRVHEFPYKFVYMLI